MDRQMHYFKSPAEIVDNLNEALGRSRADGNLLFLSGFRSHLHSPIERFLEKVSCGILEVSSEEIKVRGSFDLRVPSKRGTSLWNISDVKGRLFIECGDSEGGVGVYERMCFSGFEYIDIRNRCPGFFDVSFSAGQKFGRDYISRGRSFYRNMETTPDLKEVFPNQCFVRHEYISLLESR